MLAPALPAIEAKGALHGSEAGSGSAGLARGCDRAAAIGDLERLLSIMIHQIRNHCMSIKGYASLLGYEEGLSERSRKWIANIGRGVGDLEVFLAAFEAYRLSREPGRVSIDVALAIRKAAGPLIAGDAAGCPIDIEVSPGLRIEGDPNDFEKMMYHLVRNAVEAVGAAGRVRVSAEASGEAAGWRIAVEDNGCGMAGEVLDRSTEVLYTTKKGHIGCGLAVASAVASRLGAELSIASSPGEGCLVRIERAA